MENQSKHEFDADLEIKQIEPQVFEVTLSGSWANSGTPNGGYLMGVIARTMIFCSDTKDLPILTANYIGRSRPGKALVHVEPISATGSFRRVMARLIQDGEEKVRAMGSFIAGNIGESEQDYEAAPPEMVPLESGFQMLARGINSLYDRLDLKLDPSCIGWIKKSLSRPMVMKGWVSFKEKRKLDVPSILMFADAFPPPVFVAHGPSAWVPTIEMSVNIRKVPDDRILQGVFKSRFVSSGLVEEDGELWDSSGDLVAISRQYSLYRKK